MMAKPSPNPRSPRARYSSEVSEVPFETLDSVGMLIIDVSENSTLWQGRDCHLIKACHAVGLGPKRNPARFHEGLVGYVEQGFAVIRDGKTLTLGAQAEQMPFVWGNS